MAWRMAKSLEILREQLNVLSPNRSKASDGGIGNAEHSARDSDHNPDTDGVVKARDFTHDPAHGIDSQKIADKLLASRDPRIKYLISNSKIASGDAGPAPWVWRPYSGKNPHNHHFHISVKKDAAHYDSALPWKLDLAVPAEVAAKPSVPGDPMLRQGSKGPDVVRLQTLLNGHGAVLKEDGDFGAVTVSAVKIFQAAHDLVSDGVVGTYTWEALKRPAATPASPPVKPPASREIHIIAQRGLLGGPPVGYSLGLDALIAKATKEALNVTSTILSYSDDDDAYKAAMRARAREAAIVVMGHSLGASDAVALANRLLREGAPVALIFVFDPTWNNPAPPVEGKGRAVNFYGTSTLSPLGHDKLEPAPGFTGKIFNVGINVQHQNVDDDLSAHQCFLAELRVLAGKSTALPDYSKIGKA